LRARIIPRLGSVVLAFLRPKQRGPTMIIGGGLVLVIVAVVVVLVLVILRGR
jgi:hypothetical protein